MKPIIPLTAVFFTLLVSCGETNKKAEATQQMTTPVAEKELSEMKPDRTLEDTPSVLDVLRDNTDYDAFYKAAKAANFIPELNRIDSGTLFAPQNDAFNKLTDAKLAYLKTPEGRNELLGILRYHVVKDEYDAETLLSTIRLNEGVLRLQTLNGTYIALREFAGTIAITDELTGHSTVIAADQEAHNGVVHGINNLLLPQ